MRWLIVAAFCFAGPLFAAEQAAREFKASDLTGMPVTDVQGQRIGRITDLVLNVGNGALEYAVVRFDRTAAERNMIYALLGTELDPAADGRSVRTAMANALQGITGWPVGDWPNFVNTEHVRATRIIGREVAGSDQRKLGNLKDLVVDLARQKVHFAVVEFEPGILAQERLAALPLSAFVVNRDTSPGFGSSPRLVLNAERGRLAGLTGFSNEELKRIDSPAFLARVERDLAQNAAIGSSAPRSSVPPTGGR